jgi:F0F1-type ATP synthase membrane subunit b/b'
MFRNGIGARPLALPLIIGSLLFLLLSPAASSAADDKKARIAQEMAAASKCDMRSDKGLKDYVQYLTNVIEMEPEADLYLSVLQKRASALQVDPSTTELCLNCHRYLF